MGSDKLRQRQRQTDGSPKSNKWRLPKASPSLALGRRLSSIVLSIPSNALQQSVSSMTCLWIHYHPLSADAITSACKWCVHAAHMDTSSSSSTRSFINNFTFSWSSFEKSSFDCKSVSKSNNECIVVALTSVPGISMLARIPPRLDR